MKTQGLEIQIVNLMNERKWKTMKSQGPPILLVLFCAMASAGNAFAEGIRYRVEQAIYDVTGKEIDNNTTPWGFYVADRPSRAQLEKACDSLFERLATRIPEKDLTGWKEWERERRRVSDRCMPEDLISNSKGCGKLYLRYFDGESVDALRFHMNTMHSTCGDWTENGLVHAVISFPNRKEQ